MKSKRVVIKKTTNGLPRWLILTDPHNVTGTALILKGHYPKYIFEIIPVCDDPECYRVHYYGTVHHVMVRKYLDEGSESAERYVYELIEWYATSKARPTLQQINTGRMVKKVAE